MGDSCCHAPHYYFKNVHLVFIYRGQIDIIEMYTEMEMLVTNVISICINVFQCIGVAKCQNEVKTVVLLVL